jgi:hypothetical protein
MAIHHSRIMPSCAMLYEERDQTTTNVFPFERFLDSKDERLRERWLQADCLVDTRTTTHLDTRLLED